MAIKPMASIAVCLFRETQRHFYLRPVVQTMFYKTKCLDLPLPNVLYSLSERPLKAGAQFQGITADLNDVVDESTHGRQGKRRGEKHHIAKLDEHLLVVLQCVLFRPNIRKLFLLSTLLYIIQLF